MNKLDSLIKLIADSNVKILLAIFVVSVSSLWLLLFYFFSWEEFSFFYAYQNPAESDVVFKAPGFANHPDMPYLKFLFDAFGYNPYPYNIISIIIFCLLSITVYFFSIIVGKLSKKQGLFAGLLFAAGYYGIGTFTTNTLSGINGGVGLMLSLLSIICFGNLLAKTNLINLQLFLLSYLLAIGLFPARSYFLPGLLAFYYLFSNQNTSQLAAGMNGSQKNLPEGILRSLLRSSSFSSKKVVKAILIGGILLLPVAFFLSRQVGVYTSSLLHIDFKIIDLFRSLFGNIGNTFFPSMVTKKETIAISLGLLISAVSLWRKDTRMLFIFLLISLTGQLFAIIVNSQYFSIWQSDNHFLSSFTVFSSVIIAIFLKKYTKVLMLLIIFIILLSNIEVYNQLKNHSNRLRYFYETIQKEVPKKAGKQVVLIYSKYPKPLDPFIHLPEIPGEYYVPGFYYKRASDMLVTQDYSTAMDFFNKNNLNPEDINVLTFADNNLHNVSKEFRETLLKGNNTKVIKELTGLNITGLFPAVVKISATLQTKDERTDLNLLNFSRWHKDITVETIPNKPHGDRKKEYLLDSDFETTWIPDNWQFPIAIILKLPEPKIIGKIIWSSSRTNPWPQRIPTEYNFSVSNDGTFWKEVIKIKNGEKLLKDQYKTEEINLDEKVSFIKMDIYKTAQGALPSMDEIQIIPSEYTDIEYKKLNEFLKSQIQKFCLEWTTNDDSEFRSQRQECSIVETDGSVIIKIEPRIEKVTGFRVVNGEGNAVNINNLEINYLIND